MNLLKLIKNVVIFNRKPSNAIDVEFREMVLIINPHATASMTVAKGSEIEVTGQAGTVWVTAEGNPIDYQVRNGDTVKIHGSGKIVMQSLAEHVPGRLLVTYQPPMRATH
jgi:formylmethanofuran dehydrogenase subunit D